MKIKIFEHFDSERLEEMINTWISETVGIEILDVEYQVADTQIDEYRNTSMHYSAMITYRVVTEGELTTRFLKLVPDKETVHKLIQDVRNYVTPFGSDHPELVDKLRELIK